MEGDEHVSQTFYKRQKFLLAAAKNEKLNYTIRKRALSGINPVHEALDFTTLQEFSQSPNIDFQIEAIRSLGARTKDKAAIEYLQTMAKDDKLVKSLRLEAIIGLAHSIKNVPASKDLLLGLLKSKETSEFIKAEASRSLSFLSTNESIASILAAYKDKLPSDSDGNSMDFWRQEGRKTGNGQAGARVFFHPRYQCGNCHRIDGRGGIFGPDLSHVGSNADRQRIIESILQPSGIVTPTYTGYMITDKEGEAVSGRLDKDLDSKRHLQLITADGQRASVAYDAIAEQNIMEVSLMPANLHRQMTAKEFRDMIQFLAERK